MTAADLIRFPNIGPLLYLDADGIPDDVQSHSLLFVLGMACCHLNVSTYVNLSIDKNTDI
ncbi:hypothetical protein PPOP_1554 [Paenibacillus popilliae ATCC 14706]|uniref:Uncharacterized protein n=2 Tax=Paenibacillus popilliae TaxID=78057 RepID=M9L9Q7_PAEPP|nr:hypothetical protein PPOP_1554 [Paenibacillus popilliae ATCC 14706]